MVFAVLTPALYAGGRILYDMTQSQPLVSFNWIFMGCVLIISIITAAYCIYGGLSSVVWTDVLQVTVLVVGGLIVVVFGLDKAGGLSRVLQQNLAANPERFSLIQEISHSVSPCPGVATFWLTLSLWYVCPCFCRVTAVTALMRILSGTPHGPGSGAGAGEKPGISKPDVLVDCYYFGVDNPFYRFWLG
jgi:Na+/proline symporter